MRSEVRVGFLEEKTPPLSKNDKVLLLLLLFFGGGREISKICKDLEMRKGMACLMN